ncbi:MAG: class I SAM-dependent methyltransferase, partial [Deltaproteobacteria bacterium]|nr:class I SAM-dependent methyltransferase [Deltaproteobacteria bacterium]
VRLRNHLKSTSAIVEVGCGRGRVLESLFDHGFRDLTGFDAASAMVEQARYRLPTLSFETIVPPHLPVPDASVDGVLLFAVLTCIVDRGKRLRFRQRPITRIPLSRLE